MRKIIMTLNFFCMLAGVFFITDKPVHAENQNGYIVKLKNNYVSATGADEFESDTESFEVLDEAEQLYYADTMEEINASDLAGVIEYVEPDYTVSLYGSISPNDPCYAKQWYLSDVNIDDMWQRNIDGQDLDDTIDMDSNGNASDDPIVIAVVDSGMISGISDIDETKILTGKNILDDTTDVTDDVWHGTFITGMLVATRNNNMDISGLLQNTKILPIKAFNQKTSTYSAIIKSISYATEQKILYNDTNGKQGINVCVINLSLGGSKESKAMKEVCQKAVDQGIILVCAAGNEGNTNASFPAQYSMGVGSVNQKNQASAFSQVMSADQTEGCQKKVWVCAPGENIYSFDETTELISANGTSFSCPIVSALAAMLKGLDNNLTQADFMDITKNSSVYVDSGFGKLDNQDVVCGYGLVNFKNAYDYFVNQQKDPCADGHDYQIVKTVSPTCTKNGSTSYACSRCGAEKTENIRALGHDYWREIKKATCTENGYEKYTCRRCGCIGQNSVVKATGHIYKKTKVTSTYTSKGYTIYTCTKCGDTYKSGYKAILKLSVPKISSVKNQTTGVKITWKKITGAKGYFLYRKDKNSWKRIGTVSGATFADKEVKSGTKYTYRLQAYTGSAKSQYSSTKNICYLKQIKISKIQKNSIENKKKQNVIVKYKSDKAVSGYQIQYGTNKTYSKAKTVNVKSNKTDAYTIKNLTKGKTYYIRIRSYKKTGNTKCYSAWNNSKIK